MTGGIPGFMDVVSNLDSSALNQDNIIDQIHKSGRKIIFYGDDTWIRMFPRQFARKEGVTSFFVTDHEEVMILNHFYYALLRFVLWN